MNIDNYDAPSCVARALNTYPPQASALKNAINQAKQVNIVSQVNQANKSEDSTIIASFNRSSDFLASPAVSKDFGVINNRVLQDNRDSGENRNNNNNRNNHVVQETIGSLNYSLKPFPKNVVIGSAANSGIGLSTTLALLASNIASKKYVVALIDADISNGGLDVLLGLEQDEGRRLQEVQAPLGRLDGYVLRCELLHWNNVDILAYSPWKNQEPKPWVIEAAIRGLAKACDVVIVDIGSGLSARKLLQDLPTLAEVPTIFAAELSVLGLARLRAHWRNLELDNKNYAKNLTSIVAGLNPRGLSNRFCPVEVGEACDYLLCNVEGPIGHDSKMYEDIIGGYGIRGVPKCAQATVGKITTWLLGTSRESGLMASTAQGNQSCKYGRFSKILGGKHGSTRY